MDEHGHHGNHPWGIHAVGGPRTSGGTRRVYVIDSGVGSHSDLNIVEQAVAGTGQAVTCHPHATHVAGIIAARANNAGVVGVLAGAPIVSVSVARNVTTSPCKLDAPASNVEAAMDLVKARIISSGVVGVVNISMNGPAYAVGTTLANKLQALATPNAAQGHPGAFIAQSAGNGYTDACSVSYSARNPSDGIMVVGAIDDNGQPVQPLNGTPRFRNPGRAGTEMGSNFGPCVEAWAPGNVIRSTWSGGTYVDLSGTSMAAPHVAGVAAYLAESQGLTTPAQIEAAVRARRVTLTNSTATLPNLNQQSFVAGPTVEFAYNRTYFPTPQEDRFTQYNNSDVLLTYESIGAQYCNLRVYRNGGFWAQTPSMPPSYTWSSYILSQPGEYRWDLDCVSPQGVHSLTSITGTILRAVTRVAWFITSSSTGNVWKEFTGDPASVGENRFTWNPGTSFSQRYEAVGADTCELRSSGYRNFGWEVVELYYSGPGGTTYETGPHYPGDPLTTPPPLGPYEGYRWSVTCSNAEGSSMTATVHGTIAR